MKELVDKIIVSFADLSVNSIEKAAKDVELNLLIEEELNKSRLISGMISKVADLIEIRKDKFVKAAATILEMIEEIQCDNKNTVDFDNSFKELIEIYFDNQDSFLSEYVNISREAMLKSPSKNISNKLKIAVNKYFNEEKEIRRQNILKDIKKSNQAEMLQIEKLVIHNNIEKALELAINICNMKQLDTLHTDFLLLQSRFQEISKKNDLGLIRYSDYSIELNQIKYSTLKLYKKLRNTF